MRNGIGALLALFAIGCTEGDGLALPPAAATLKSAADLETELMELVNSHRVSLGLDALVDVSQIAAAARSHSEDMAARDYFAHASPEGETAGDRLNEAGVGWESVGENIAGGFSTPEDTFHAWMGSPGHREILERDGWTHTGVGYAQDADPAPEAPYVHFWTQNFVR